MKEIQGEVNTPARYSRFALAALAIQILSLLALAVVTPFLLAQPPLGDVAFPDVLIPLLILCYFLPPFGLLLAIFGFVSLRRNQQLAGKTIAWISVGLCALFYLAAVVFILLPNLRHSFVG